MMSESKSDDKKGNWKKHLLSSGLPLEYEVACILAVKNMAVSADYCYLRTDGSHKKEFSVDIEATFYGGDEVLNEGFALHALVECKYRSRDKFLLYARDPNIEYPNGTLGGTVSQFDSFVPLTLPRNAFVKFEEQIPYVYKGMELSSGGNIEKDVRQGIEQLRYGIPQLLRDSIDFNLSHLDEERIPFFLTKILVTNAPIRVLKDGLTIQDIEQSDAIAELSDETDLVVLCSDYGPDYEAHFSETFRKGLGVRHKVVSSLENRLVAIGAKYDSLNSPTTRIQHFAKADRFELNLISTQFFVTTLTGLPKLVEQLQTFCQACYDGRAQNGKISEVADQS